MIHPLADVQTENIGLNTAVWQFCVILKGAVIGNNCNINSNVFIENKVIVGDNVTIKSGVQLWDGMEVQNNVFIGPNVTFTNDLHPRSKNQNWSIKKVKICYGASIGANSTIIAGVSIGKFALIGAGSVIIKDIPSFTLWYGNPAKQKGFVTQEGIVLNMNFEDKDGNVHELPVEF